MSDDRRASIQREAAERIEQAMAAEGLPIRVEDDGEVLRLDGLVDTDEARQAAADLAALIAPQRRVVNDLEIEEVWPTTASDLDQPAGNDLSDTVSATLASAEIEPDFTAQQLETSTLDMGGEASATADPEQDGETVVFPPTDPVVTINDDGDLEVLGGFAPTAMDELADELPISALDGEPGDEAIADVVRRALRRDALTTDLAIRVAVRDGVAYLRGTVATLDDVDSAEEVASRVPGVTDVVEELEIAGF